MTTSSRNRKRKKTAGGTDETEFSRYLDGAYKAAVAKIDALATEAREAIAQLYHYGEKQSESNDVTIEDEIRAEGTYRERHDSEPPDRFCSDADVHDPHQWEDGEQIYYCLGVSYELIPCAQQEVHDEHEWTHPDGRPCWCLGVGVATVAIARNEEILDNTTGYPSQKIYVLEEDCLYEYVNDEKRWQRVDGGENQVDQEG